MTESVEKRLQLLETCKHICINAIVQTRGQLCYVEGFDITAGPEEMPLTVRPCFVKRQPPFDIMLSEVTAVLVTVERLKS